MTNPKVRAIAGAVSLYPFIRPLVFKLGAETAHRATIAALKLAPKGRPPVFPASLRTTLAGLEFPSPVGLAAGFDKDAEVPEQMLGLGFGFVERSSTGWDSTIAGSRARSIGCSIARTFTA